MKTISDRMLGQYLAGALEPPERRRVEQALAELPHARARLSVLEAGAHPSSVDVWVIPPPTLPAGLAAHAAPVASMDAGPAGWLVVRLVADEGHHDHLVVVLEREGSSWSVVFPLDPTECLTLSSLPAEGGQRRLDLAAGASRRVAVALVPPSLSVDFGQQPSVRWEAVRNAVIAGDVPVVSFDTP